MCEEKQNRPPGFVHGDDPQPFRGAEGMNPRPMPFIGLEDRSRHGAGGQGIPFPAGDLPQVPMNDRRHRVTPTHDIPARPQDSSPPRSPF